MNLAVPYRLNWAWLCLALGISILACLCWGAISITPAQAGHSLLSLFTGESGPAEQRVLQVLWAIRVPRVLMACLVGMALGLSGACLQGLFRNPVASPGLLGISAGAGLAAAAYIVLVGPALAGSWAMLGQMGLALAGFVGACAVGLVILRLGSRGGRTVIAILLLAGVAIQALASAATGILVYAADEAQLRDITFWSMGSLGGASWLHIAAMAPFIVLPALLLPRFGSTLNALSLGEDTAMTLGIQVERAKLLLFGLSTLAIAAAVAFAGSIGFVGLIVPHIARKLVGPDHRVSLPASALLGALLLLLADTLARTLLAPREIPIGILTALLGAPFFLHLLRKLQHQLLAH
jgi:iron complex transport system permease protein